MKNDETRSGFSAVPLDIPVRPRAWAHDGARRFDVIHDEAKTLWLNSWPEQVEHYTLPLYAPEDFVADVIGLDQMRELCALLVDLDNVEDPQRVPFPAIEDRDPRAHARKCSNAIRLLMRRIVGAGPNAKGQRGAACGASAAPTGCASNDGSER